MALEEYRSKRDFERTPEPSGAGAGGEGSSFVVHKHAARQLHFDLRLEHAGVLMSWAVPKGPSLDPSDKRLAVHVEDHPLDYGGFEGVIPAGEYGAGTVMLWDAGTWEPLGETAAMLAKGDLKFRLHGHKLRGEWVLARMRPRPGEKRDNWLLIKHRDPEAREKASFDVASLDVSVASGRSMDEIARADAPSGLPSAFPDPPPGFALATLAREAPEGPGWIHEVKLDGYRAMLTLRDGKAAFLSRSGGDWTGRFSSLVGAAERLGASEALIDGEVCVLEPDGRTSFRALEKALASGGPLTFFAFDLLHLDGRDLRQLPLAERKRRLASLLGAAGARGPLRYLDHIEASGRDFHAQACRLRLEGSVSKRADSPRREGRTRDWLKVKCRLTEEVVVGGWTDSEEGRSGFGSLLVGIREAGGLRFAGRVGSGFSQAELERIGSRLRELETEAPPFRALPDQGAVGVHWARPELVVRVAFAEWTDRGLLRQASYLGPVNDARAGDGRSAETPPARRPRLTNPERVLWPGTGMTKLGLVEYWEAVAERALPHLARRPLTLVRCPEGHERDCFYQKHAQGAFPASVRRVPLPAADGVREYVVVEDAAGLAGLAQMGVLEVHPWNALASSPELPDRLVLDLDPGPGTAWADVVRAAEVLREALAGTGLSAFVKTTGGSGLHVVSPIEPGADWERVRAFARSLAVSMSSAEPSGYTASMRRTDRQGRVFIDYLRNAREATAVAAYSPRAREGALVSAPLTWEELTGGVTPEDLTMRAAIDRMDRADPWAAYEARRRPLPQGAS